MSTIASPRDPSRRIPSFSQTPTSSTRPSLEASRSVTGSPNPNAVPTTASASASASTPTAAGLTSPVAGNAAAARRNRAALREYYNLKKTGNMAPTLEVTEADDDQQPPHYLASYSEVPPSEMDRPGFDAAAYVTKTLQTAGLQDLLRTYTRVLSEMRALDAEKKGLVYDNYSRLITATETIRKMRVNMDPLNPMASTLDPAIAHIYNQAKALRDTLRQAVPAPGSPEAETTAARARSRELAAVVLETPDRLRQLVRDGHVAEARAAWERPRQLLELWRDRGLGGDDVVACLADGDAALRRDPGGVSER